MTVSSTTARQTYLGDGSAGGSGAPYSYNFRIFDDADLALVKRNTSTGAETLLALGTDYTVTGAGSYSGGTFTLTAGNLPAGYALAAFRELDLLQATDLRNQGAYLAEVQERALDRLVMIAQQLQDQLNRAIRLPDSEAGGDLLKLPAKEIRAGKQLTFDPTTADPTVSNPSAAAVSAAMQVVVASATLALARAAMGPWGDARVTATGGTKERSLADRAADVFNVKDFHAVGDGATDDSAAIQATIDACKAAGGGVVFFPRGRYRCASRLKVQNTTTSNIYICFVGQGAGNANVPSTMAGSILVGDTGGILLDLAGCSFFYGSNFGIASGSASPSTIGVLFQRTASDSYCQEVRLDRVNIGLATAPAANSGLGSIAIVNKRGEHHHYSDCKFTSDTPLLMDGASAYTSIVSPDYAESYPGGSTLQLNQFDNCEFIAIAYDCVVMRSPGGVLMNNPYFGAPAGRAGIVAAFVNGLRIINGLIEPSSGNPARFVSLIGNCWNWDVELKSAVPSLVGIDGATAGASLTIFKARFIDNFANIITGNFYQGEIWYSSVTNGHTINLTDGAGTIDKHDRDETAMTWTPVVRFGGASVGITYGAALRGTYTRCKNRIIAQCNIPLTSKGSSAGALTIAGLPFASKNASGFNQTGQLLVNNMAAGITAPLVALVQPNAQVVDVFKMSAGSLANVTDADCTNTTALVLTLIYEI